MSFSAKNIRFLVEFSFVLSILVKATCAGLKSLFSAKIKIEHGTEFFNHSKNSFKEGRIITSGSFLLLLCQVHPDQFNCEKRLLLTVKINCSVFIRDLERENDFFYA